MRRGYRPLDHEPFHGHETLGHRVDAHEYAFQRKRAKQGQGPFFVEQDEGYDLTPLDSYPRLADVHQSDFALPELKTLLGYRRYAQVSQHRRRDRSYGCTRVDQRVERRPTLAFPVTDADRDAE